MTHIDKQFFAPKYWLTWVGLGILYLISLLPYPVQIKLGNRVGDLMHRLFKSRRHITQVNIRLCFPDKSEEEQRQLVRDIFRNNAIGLFETSMSWWTSDKRLNLPVTLQGKEHLDEAIALGKGVILLGAHFSTLDMGGRLLSRFYDVDAMYREHNNLLMDSIIKACREKHLGKAIERESLRSVLRALRKNRVVWYAPDQDFGPKHSVYAPFFGVSAATITATTRMVKLNNSPILMFTHHRKADNSGYELEIFPVIKDFPSGDEIADATRINQELEKGIRKDPAQYMWVHRRFKTHPEGKNYVYKT
ncbi:LpxL/LpxP family Kdo(2)-lipid IV(A) lauroyl/palmitoleoyl acyltransferase [Neptunomonas antarctica]|uniref:Lipid A biosynthesis acyltransferase n=1 Tax=Neptunomonas antarctica TaxID=619304 RepID=A0A1N7J0P5_9GAMM|nr:LpxL/LpxP family Kdo(2)-lipid IV(A) lauroyl/palmitoleoyl acyltransferase [Neptunomonas antarctica]SIS42935.1 KDO2-lipid IV(A) lauroyltransferase [Neptunomonas antarctica]